jgi:dephospho-CoA kinase
LTIVIGLTGGIATGKSTVAEMLKNDQIPVIDADILAREAVFKGKPAYKKIIEEFGNGILLENGELNRKKLGDIVFSNEEKRQILNQIIHPEVRKEMIKQRDDLVKRGENLVVLDIPLLFESGLENMVDYIVVVAASENIQLERLMKRNHLTEEQARNRINAQLPLEIKKQKADDWIDNSGERSETKAQVDRILKKLYHE